MPDVAVDPILLCFVEYFVPSAGIKPVGEVTVTMLHLAGDEVLDRDGPGADRIVGPGDEQDRQVDRDTRFVFRKPEAVEPFMASAMRRTLYCRPAGGSHSGAAEYSCCESVVSYSLRSVIWLDGKASSDNPVPYCVNLQSLRHSRPVGSW